MSRNTKTFTQTSKRLHSSHPAAAAMRFARQVLYTHIIPNINSGFLCGFQSRTLENYRLGDQSLFWQVGQPKQIFHSLK